MADVGSPLDSNTPRHWPLAAKILGSVLLLLVLAVAVVALLPASFWKWLITHEITAQTGRKASIDGPVQVRIFSLNPRLTLQGLSVANADWARPVPLLTLRRFEIVVRLAPLFHGEVLIPRLVIDAPRLDIERDSSERLNFALSTPGKPRAGHGKPIHIPAIQQLRLTHGTLTVSDAVMKLRFDGSVAIEAAADAPGIGALNVHGKGTLNAKPFELQLNGEPLLNVDHDHPYGFEAALRAADIKLAAHVVIPHPFDLASLQAKFSLSGADLADVYYLTALALPNTPPYQVSGTLVRDGQLFRIEDFRGRIGASDIAGKLQVDMNRDRPKLTAALTSKELRLADLAAPLGAQAPAAETSAGTIKPNPAPKTGQAPAAGPGAADDPALLLPDADLQVDRVRAMDADVSFEAASVLTAKLPLKKLSFHLNLDDGRLKLAPLAFTLPQGQFSGSVVIDARNATPQTDLDMKLTNVDLSQFKPKDGGAPPLQGELLGRVKLHGVGASVHKAAQSANGDITVVIPHGEMSDALAELTGIDLRGVGLFLTKKDAKADIRCGAANLHASDGDFKATTFLIDTTHVVITAEGHAEMENERLDFAVRGQPKQVRLLRLRTPIVLKGTLEHPEIGVQPGKALAQAGGAAALGVLLTPLAAVLAFVDGGLAKNADCAALLGQAEHGHNLTPKNN